MAEKLDKQQEKILVDRALSDLSAFGELYEANVDRIYNYCYYKLYDAEKAQDITSEVFTKALDAFANGKYKWDDNVGFSGWLYRLAHNTLVDFYKKASTKREFNLDEDIQFKGDFDFSEVEEKLDNEQLEQKIQEVSAQFDDQSQSILVLKFKEEYTFEQIAETLEINLSTVKMKYYRALDVLKTKLKEYSEQ